MKDAAMKAIRIDWDDPPNGETDWDRLDRMSDAEATRNAFSDPDNPPAEAFPDGTRERTLRPQWIRRRLGMSQREFAETFEFPLRSLQQWEQGRCEPNQAIRAYLRVIAVESEAVKRALSKDAIA